MESSKAVISNNLTQPIVFSNHQLGFVTRMEIKAMLTGIDNKMLAEHFDKLQHRLRTRSKQISKN